MLTGKREQAGGRVSDVAVVPVPDPRTARLVEIFSPPKIVHAEITFLDLLSVRQGDSCEGEALELVKIAGDADAFVLVLQCFGVMDSCGNTLDPAADLETVLLEMALTDLQTVETRLGRLAKATVQKKEVHQQWEMDILQRCQEHLSQGGAIRDLGLAEDELKYLRGFSLLTLKPWMVALNVDEDDLEGERAAGARAICAERHLPWVVLCAPLEEEIAQLPPEEQASFAADYGLQDLGRDRLIRAAYSLLRVITFFTAGEKEVHAWTVSEGATAPDAAGRIHSDLEAGFIRAEIIPFAAMDEHCSEKLCRDHGLMRVEGRTYKMTDGDLVFIRFSR
jgi:hypothetical protein